MHPARLRAALEVLARAMDQVNAVLAELGSEHDPLALHIFASRRRYRGTEDTKGGRRREMAVRLSYGSACDLGFRGSLDEWERLLGAAPKR